VKSGGRQIALCGQSGLLGRGLVIDIGGDMHLTDATVQRMMVEMDDDVVVVDEYRKTCLVVVIVVGGVGGGGGGEVSRVEG